jgi:hypothetical protein
VLVEHRVDDVDERLVAVEEPVPAGEQIALEPPLALVLGQDLHHAPVGRQVLVRRQRLRVPCPRRDGEHVPEPVRRRLVGPEQAEVLGIAGDHVP